MIPQLDLGQSEPVTVVIPAYNEEKWIGHILDVLGQVTELTQIIVVDDGSTDKTAAILYECQQLDRRIHLVRLPVNCGKGGAMLAGANASHNDLIVFLDADLIGLGPEHILALIEPVQLGRCCMTLGIFTGGRWQTDWSHRLTPFLSGQRCLRWSLFRLTPHIATTRWGIELALSLHAWSNCYGVVAISWYGVTHAMRSEKMDNLKACWSHLQMWTDIGKYLVRYLLGQKKSPVQLQPSRVPPDHRDTTGKPETTVMN